MHAGFDPIPFHERAAGLLGPYYLILAALNVGAALLLWLRWNRPVQAGIWAAVAAVYTIVAAFIGSGTLLGMPKGAQDVINSILTGNKGAVIYTVGTTVLLIVLYVGRRFFVQPPVAWTLLNVALLLLGASMVSPPFREIVAKEDNVPIVGLVFLLGFFTWLAAYRAVQNDDRANAGLPPLEKEDNEKVLVWPDLVYTELICMIAITVVLIVWAILIKAPLEEPASSVKTPNPSKAPWYFLGLQEMLVYYDPWMAGVVLPSMIIVGLMAIPYIDFNKQGNGYYTIEQRPFAYIMFQIGFLELWVTLIVLGTFLRGPNWNFFGPYEPWDAHKVLALNNKNLSDILWIDLLGASLPKVTAEMGALEQLGVILKREGLGIILVLAYLLLLPPLLAVTLLRKFFARMGFIRYMVLANLLLFMAALPIKMFLRWTIDLKYIVAIPEVFLNL
jgi:hypothetical protein